MKRPQLNEIKKLTMDEILKYKIPSVTMSPEQWDELLQHAYDTGWLLLEIVTENEIEYISRAYRKEVGK